MRKVYLTITTVCLIAACSSPGNELEFAGYECLRLSEKDRVLDNNLYLEHYERFLIDSLEVPLHRAIRNDSLTIYIGLELASDIKEVNRQVKKNALSSKKVGELYNAYFEKVDDDFLLRYVYFQDQINYSIVISFIAEDSLLIKSLFEKEDLISTLLCDE